MAKQKQKQRAKAKTSMWHVSLCYDRTLGGLYVVCGTKEPERTMEYAGGHVKFRSITARAAVRKYVKENLPSILYKMDDGGNDPSEIDELRPKDRKSERRYMKRVGRNDLLRDETGNVKVVYQG